MDSDGLPIVGSGIDLKKVQAIHKKRTLAFLNHFISHTVQFLNNFSNVCETKLADVSVRLQRLDTAMNLLEAKLASIPGLENITLEKQSLNGTTDVSGSSGDVSQQEQSGSAQSKDGNESLIEQASDATDNADVGTKTTVSSDPRYSKFFKMLSLGVPMMAVKQKVAMEGLNPDLIDTPNASIDISKSSDSRSAPQDSDIEFSDNDSDNSDSSVASAFSD